jgi:SAM-dependent methyltransferase
VDDATYTRRFGGDRVTRSDVIHVEPGAPHATIIADLADAPQIPSSSFDCAIVTQTLHLLYEPLPAVRTLHRILKPGGVLLLTVPGVSQIDRAEWRESWHWSFSSHSARRMFGDVFGPDSVQVKVYGNVLSAMSFLHGVGAGELTKAELDVVDDVFQVTVAVRAVKR